MWREAVWAELERRGATAAIVPFCGRAGHGGHADTVRLSRPEGGEPVVIERCIAGDELCYALQAPIWDRFGTFIGHPSVRGEVIWSTEDRSVVIRGRRGGRVYEEPAA